MTQLEYMLEPRHILRLKLDRRSLEEHNAMPPPRYVSKPLIGRFAALNDTIVSSIAGIGSDAFARQMDDARACGASVLCEDAQNNTVGMSAATSLIKSGDVMRKNLIVPQDMLRQDHKLADRIVISAFVRGSVEDGELLCEDDVEIAGWATAKDIQMLQSAAPPPTFQSKLSIVTVPCGLLRPMSSLIERFASGELKPGYTRRSFSGFAPASDQFEQVLV